MPEQSDGNLSDGHVVIGIDQSYTGFAATVLALDGSAYATTCRPLKGAGIDRLHDAQDIVYGLLNEYSNKVRVKDVAIEGYAYGASQNAHMAGELGASLKLALARYGRTPLIPSPSQVKKFATGKGNAKKAEMLLAVYKVWGIEFNNDNMADSYTIARIATGEGRNKEQRAVVDLVRKSRGDI